MPGLVAEMVELQTMDVAIASFTLTALIGVCFSLKRVNIWFVALASFMMVAASLVSAITGAISVRHPVLLTALLVTALQAGYLGGMLLSALLKKTTESAIGHKIWKTSSLYLNRPKH